MDVLRKKLKIALVQMRCEKRAGSENLGRMIAYLEEAVAYGAEVVCFPDMCIPGYVDPSKCPSGILHWNGPEVKHVLEWSNGKPVTAIVGIVEKNPDGSPFISQGVVRDGRLSGTYRKHTIDDQETNWFAAGESFPVFHHPGLTFGVAICTDVGNQRVVAELVARGGASSVFLAAAPGLYGKQWTRNWESGYNWWKNECREKLSRYARDYGVHIAATTQAGRTVD